MKANLTIPSVDAKVYWVIVNIKNTKTGEGKKLHWKDLPWAVRSKWDWYFKYRAALAQVQHPRWHVDMAWGSDEATGVILARHQQNVLRAKKATITKVSNAITAAKANWKDLFPIENNHHYQRATAKLERLKTELVEYESQLAN